MNREETIRIVKDFVVQHSNAENAIFASKLILTKYKINGCKTPDVVSFAKQIVKAGVDINDLPLESHEEIVLAGFVLAYSKTNAKQKVEYLDKYIKMIDNWAVCDTVVCRLKNMESEKDYFYTLLSSNYEFVVRVGIIWLMRFDLKINTRDVVDKLCKIQNDAYYVKMGIAWCLAEALLYDYDYVKTKLSCIKDEFIRNKTISKARDSFRITAEQKEELKKLKLNPKKA